LHSISVSWQDSWLDGSLAWFPGPLSLESIPPWWLWGSLLSASNCEVSVADWLAVGCDPLITGWKLSKCTCWILSSFVSFLMLMMFVMMFMLLILNVLIYSCLNSL